MKPSPFCRPEITFTLSIVTFFEEYEFTFQQLEFAMMMPSIAMFLEWFRSTGTRA